MSLLQGRTGRLTPDLPPGIPLGHSLRLRLRLLVGLSVLLLLALFTGAIAQGSVAPATEESVLSVVGHGVAYGEPDIATLELGVSATDPDAGTAMNEIDEGIAAVMDALAGLGVQERDIRTTSFNIWREERFPRDDSENPVTVFRAQHMLAVELEGAQRAGEILSAAVDAGANAVGGITFGFSNPDELEAQAREAAVKDARERAQQLASVAGVAVGAPLSIEEISGSQPPGPYFERSAAVMSASPIAPGELSVEIRVAIRYRIEMQ
ncbi:MAG: SIMPL domain-containing protein [Trueperaceae bacterium]